MTLMLQIPKAKVDELAPKMKVVEINTTQQLQHR
jgi:hypothetical protein